MCKIKVYLKPLLIFLSLLILIFSYSCNNSISQSNSSLKDCLLYIENLSGTEGLGAGKFGDLVMLDLNSNKKITLTDDDFYDAYPTYSKMNNKIVFESKRANQNAYSGLAVPTKLFQLNLNDNKITNLSERFTTKFPELVGSINELPAYNTEGTKLVFLSTNALNKKLLLYDEVNDSLSVVNDNMPSINKVIWYEGNNDALVLINYFATDKNGEQFIPIIMINIRTKEHTSLSKENWSFSLGDTYEELLLYSAHELKDNFQNSLFLYNFNTSTSKEINLPLELKNMRGIFDFHKFKNKNEIYFIGGNEDYDIYLFNLESLEYRRITDDGHIKDYLNYIN